MADELLRPCDEVEEGIERVDLLNSFFVVIGVEDFADADVLILEQPHERDEDHGGIARPTCDVNVEDNLCVRTIFSDVLRIAAHMRGDVDEHVHIFLYRLILVKVNRLSDLLRVRHDIRYPVQKVVIVRLLPVMRGVIAMNGTRHLVCPHEKEARQLVCGLMRSAQKIADGRFICRMASFFFADVLVVYTGYCPRVPNEFDVAQEA